MIYPYQPVVEQATDNAETVQTFRSNNQFICHITHNQSINHSKKQTNLAVMHPDSHLVNQQAEKWSVNQLNYWPIGRLGKVGKKNGCGKYFWIALP
jgi:hypothetical protein